MRIKNYVISGVIGASLALGGFVQADEELAKKHACLACHQVENKVVGPSYKDVANKYKGADEAKVNELAGKILKGGAGVWGPVPMPPNVNLKQEEAVILVNWILAMADGEAEAAAE